MSASFTVPGQAVYPLEILATDPPKTVTVNVSERHVPGGNINYVDIGGVGLHHIVLTLRFDTEAAFLRFQSAYGQVGTLVNFDGYRYQAIPTNPRRVAHGVLNQVSEVSIDFLILKQL